MATKRVRMLTTATGPTLHLDAGRTYDLPVELADSLLKEKAATVSEIVVVDGKETNTTRKIGTIGPFAQTNPQGTPTKGWRRNPHERPEMLDDEE